MTYLTKKHSAFAAFAIAVLSGCLPVDNRKLPDEENCAIPPVSAQEACEAEGFSFVPQDTHLLPNVEFREITYQVGGDCGEATAIARCAVSTDVCLESGAIEDPCGAAGLETIDLDLCDVVENQPTAVPTEQSRGIHETETEDAHDEPEVGCIEAEESESEAGEQEVGCATPEEPTIFCRTIEISVGCGETRTITCGVPTEEPRCPEIYAPVCGSDGVTYDNSCRAGLTPIEHDGECESVIVTDGNCFDAGLINTDSTFEIRAEWLPPESGAWLDEEGNLHTVDSGPTTQVTVNYELAALPIIDHFASDHEQLIGSDFTLESLEIRHQSYGEGELESVVLHRERWVDRVEYNVASDVESINADGELTGEFFAKLSLQVNGQPCFVEASTALFFEDEPLPAPEPEPAPPAGE